MSDEAGQLSRLIGEIYDAALDRNLWHSVLQHTCEYVDGRTAGLMSHDIHHQNANFCVTWNDDPEYSKLYAEKYARLNPAVVPSLLQTQIGEVSTILDFVPLHEWRESLIYKEFAAPQGYLDSIQAVLDKSATSYAAATVVLGEEHGPATENCRRRMEWLAPHFIRAVQIGKVIDLKEIKAAALADALDGMAAAMFLLDGRGNIVHTNSAGQVMVAEGAVLRAAGNKLVLAASKTQRTLEEMLTSLGAGDVTIGNKGASIPLWGHDTRQFVAQILPLTAGARRAAGIAYSAVAALFVREAVLSLPHPLETIANLYGLTPSEMRVLMMLIEVGGVPKVAPVLGVSETTVKTHLAHIFTKTGTQRQVDLVKLVASYMNPLA
jgi:DNA-binding CsgD family transcriptional regulator